jgi:hypothetical protein
MNYIYDPITKVPHSLDSSKGRSILKSYIQNYQLVGGSRKIKIQKTRPVDPPAIAAEKEAKRVQLSNLLRENNYGKLCEFLEIPIEATNLPPNIGGIPEVAYRALRADEVYGALTHGLRHPDNYEVKTLDAHIRAGTTAIVKSQYISLSANKCKAAIWASRPSNDTSEKIEASSGIFAEIYLKDLLVINPEKVLSVKGTAKGAAMASSELIVVGNIPPIHIKGLFKSVKITKKLYDEYTGNQCFGKKMKKTKNNSYVRWFPYDGQDPRYKKQSRNVNELVQYQPEPEPVKKIGRKSSENTQNPQKDPLPMSIEESDNAAEEESENAAEESGVGAQPALSSAEGDPVEAWRRESELAAKKEYRKSPRQLPFEDWLFYQRVDGKRFGPNTVF